MYKEHKVKNFCIVSALSVLVLVLSILVFAFASTKIMLLTLDANRIEKIEVSWYEPVATYDDEAKISEVISFFHSLYLIPSIPYIDASRVPTFFKVYDKNGEVHTISYGYTCLYYNGVYYRIYDPEHNKTDEFDRLIGAYKPR